MSETVAQDPRTLTFRVTGAASVARIEPLLLNRDQGSRREAIWSRAGGSGAGGGRGDPGSPRLDFVWETTVTKEQRQQHRNARVLNRLSGAQVRLLHPSSAARKPQALAVHISLL